MESHRSNSTSNGAPICSHSDHEAVAVAIAVRRRTENPDYVPSRDEAIRPLVKETVELLSAAAGSMYWRQVRESCHFQTWSELLLYCMLTHQVSDYTYFVDFDLGVPCFLIHVMPILSDLQLPKQNKADIVTTKSKSTTCSRRPDGSPCKVLFHQGHD